MDQDAVSAPRLISSLEAMIQASVNSLLDRRLGPAADPVSADSLDVRIQAAVAAALDKRLGPAVGSLGNRMTSLVEQRLGNAVSTLNYRVDTSVTAALEQRLGTAGKTLTAQITFAPAPSSVLSSTAPASAQVFKEVNGTNENNEPFVAAVLRGKTQLMGDGGLKGKEQNTKAQCGTMIEATKLPSPDPGDELSVHVVTPGESNEPTSKESDTARAGALGSAVFPLLIDSASRSKAGSHFAMRTKPNATTDGATSSADSTTTKRRRDSTNEASDTNESESWSSEEESEHEKPKRKRSKVKLDPPGYTNGPAIKFRRVSPKLTACAKSRGHPRVIDLKSFSEASNKQNLTMADVVATVLFHYDPLSLHAFMDMDNYPKFQFIRKERDRKARNLVIERGRESYGVVVKCGYHLSPFDRAKHRSDGSRVWDTKYEYIILPVGRWVASNYTQDPIISNSSKGTIEQWATEFGTKILLGKIWEEGPGVKIESDKLVLL